MAEVPYGPLKDRPDHVDRLRDHGDRIRKLEIGVGDDPTGRSKSIKHDDGILEWLYRGAGMLHPKGLGQLGAYLWEREQARPDSDESFHRAVRNLRTSLGLMQGAVRTIDPIANTWRMGVGWLATGFPLNSSDGLPGTAQVFDVSAGGASPGVPRVTFKVGIPPGGYQPGPSNPSPYAHHGPFPYSKRWGNALVAQTQGGSIFTNPEKNPYGTTFTGLGGFLYSNDPFGLDKRWGLVWQFTIPDLGSTANGWRWFPGQAFDFDAAPGPFATLQDTAASPGLGSVYGWTPEQGSADALWAAGGAKDYMGGATPIRGGTIPSPPSLSLANVEARAAALGFFRGEADENDDLPGFARWAHVARFIRDETQASPALRSSGAKNREGDWKPVGTPISDGHVQYLKRGGWIHLRGTLTRNGALPAGSLCGLPAGTSGDTDLMAYAVAGNGGTRKITRLKIQRSVDTTFSCAVLAPDLDGQQWIKFDGVSWQHHVPT